MTTNLRLDNVHSIYDTIDPLKELRGSAAGKTVLITGAGRGKAIFCPLESCHQLRLIAATSRQELGKQLQ